MVALPVQLQVAMVMSGRGSYKVSAGDEALAPADSAGRIAARLANGTDQVPLVCKNRRV